MLEHVQNTDATGMEASEGNQERAMPELQPHQATTAVGMNVPFKEKCRANGCCVARSLSLKPYTMCGGRKCAAYVTRGSRVFSF